MSKFKPKDSEEPDFRDPLADYSPPSYDDPLAQALVEEKVAAIQGEPFATINAETSIEQAVRLLTERQIACLMVEDDGCLVGVFSDRDVLNKVAEEFDAIKHRPVSEVMTPDPIFAYENDSAAAALSVMAVSGFRHVPVVDPHRKIRGIVSPQRVTAFLQSYLEADE